MSHERFSEHRGSSAILCPHNWGMPPSQGRFVSSTSHSFKRPCVLATWWPAQSNPRWPWLLYLVSQSEWTQNHCTLAVLGEQWSGSFTYIFFSLNPVREHKKCLFCMGKKWSSNARPLELGSARFMSSGCICSDYLASSCCFTIQKDVHESSEN